MAAVVPPACPATQAGALRRQADASVLLLQSLAGRLVLEAGGLLTCFGLCFVLLSPKGRMPAVGQEAQAVPPPQVQVGCGDSTLRTLQASKCKLGIWVVAGMGAVCFTYLCNLSVF